MKLSHTIGCALISLATTCLSSRADTDVLGDWYGVIHAPMGELTLILTIAEDENGALTAELESVDQKPGEKIPITSIEATTESLTFTIKKLSASYEGTWVASEQHWSGHWKQGMELPLTFTREVTPTNAVVDGMDGTWEGTINRNGVDLRLILRATTGERGTVVTLDSPDLGAMSIPVTAFSRVESAVSFDVPATGVHYEGSLSDEDTRLTGTWAYPGRPDAVVTFVRTSDSAERAEAVRPQTPSEPFGYRAEDVVFDNPAAENVTLAGTLTLPDGAGPFPAAILISGSGGQDRDETVFSHKPFAVIADHLTRHGVAVLRFDDRGIGESTGNHDAATSADFATDASAAARYLLTRPEIDRDAIGFVGHSEGGMIGPIAAVDSDEVDFIVLLAGPGTSTVQLLLTQIRLTGLARGVSEEELDTAGPVFDQILAAAAAATDSEDARRRLESVLTPDALEKMATRESERDLLIALYSKDWFRYFLNYDAPAFLSRIDVPVLALNGSLDLQVPADENLAAIESALAHNPDVTIRKLDGLNHLFQTATTGALGEYADITETFSPDAMRIVSDWINERFASATSEQASAP